MNNIFSYIKERVDIVDAISHYVNLTPAGSYFKGISPFKYEKTASFTVTPDKKIFYCFSTHIGGDVIDFISRTENCSQYQAALILIEKYNISIPKNIKYSNNNSQEEKNTYYTIYKQFILWTEKQLLQSNKSLEYLKKRGITNKSCIEFSLGYCPLNNTIQIFTKILRLKGILLEDIYKTGIITKKNNKPFFACQDRIIFPIKNYIGMLCAYGARTITEKNSIPKYINTNQTEEFSKKKLLYGFTQAKKTIQETETIIFVEGYIDVILMHQAGYKNTVGLMGTSLTSDHIEFVKRFVTKSIIAYDGDNAGYNSIVKSISLLWNHLIDVEIILLPKNEDPASLIQKNNFDQYINKKISSIDFFTQQKKDSIIREPSLKNIHVVLSDIVEILLSIENKIKQTSLIIKISKELNISKDFIFSLLESYTKKKSTNNLIKINTKQEKDRKKETEDKIAPLQECKKDHNIWIIFFYAIIFLEKEDFINFQEDILLFRYYNYEIFIKIIQDYKNNSNQETTFLDFIKNKHTKIYLHILKIASKYVFNKRTYEGIRKKIIILCWKKYKTNNLKASLNDFKLLFNKKT